MAKSEKGSTPKDARQKSRTSYIVYSDTQKKVRYIALMEGIDITEIVEEALSTYIEKYEKKHGVIPIK